MGPGVVRRNRSAARFVRAARADPRRVGFGRPDPVCHPARRAPVQLLARRRAPARTLAAHHALVLPRRAHRLGGPPRHRRPRRRRGRGLGVQGRNRVAAELGPGANPPVARRRGCGDGARVRPHFAHLRGSGRGRLRHRRGENGCQLGGPRHHPGGHRRRPGHGDQLRLPHAGGALDPRRRQDRHLHRRARRRGRRGGL